MKANISPQMKSAAIATVSAAAAVAGLLLTPRAAEATIIVNLTDQLATAPTRTFTNAPANLTITVAPGTSSLQNFVASSANGLCLYANSSTSTVRCGVGSTETAQTYNYIQMTANRDIWFTGGTLGNQTGTASAITATSSFGGSDTIPTGLGAFSFTTPLFLSASESITFVSSGSDTSTRASTFTFEEVPGPLPLLGAAAAFGASRRIRNKIKQFS
jgi:hypothetical protein